MWARTPTRKWPDRTGGGAWARSGGDRRVGPARDELVPQHHQLGHLGEEPSGAVTDVQVIEVVVPHRDAGQVVLVVREPVAQE